MSDSTVQIPPASTGQLVATRQITVASNSVQLQCVVLGDPTTADNYAAVTAKGTQGAFAQAVQELKDAGRNPVTLSIEATVGITTEALASCTRYLGSVSSSGTSFAVSAGKTFRVQSFMVAISSTTSSSNNAIARLLWSTTTLATTSNIGPMAQIGTSPGGGGTNTANGIAVGIPDGFELAASVNYGISHVEGATTGHVTVQVVGYEY